MINVDKKHMRRMKRIAGRFSRIENVIKSGFAPSIEDMDWIENIGGRPGYKRLMINLCIKNSILADPDELVKAGV